jgi:hypothetical protein
LGIAYQFTRLLLRNSHNFISGTRHSIAVHHSSSAL